MKKIRVLHVIPGYGGGISSLVRNLVSGIDPAQVTIDVAGFTDYPREFVNEVESCGGNVFVLRNVRLRTLVSCVLQFLKIVKHGSYDAVHLHLSDRQALYFSILSSVAGIKRKIVHAHIAETRVTTDRAQKLRDSINRFLTVSAATDLASCSKLASEFRFGRKYLVAHRVMHIPNPIRESQYFNSISESKKTELRNELNIVGDKLVIGHVGFFGYQKNHPFMFQIIKKLKERNVDFIWLFVGTGYNYESYVKMAESLGIIDSVRFLGRRNDVCDLYKIMDVSVLPSFYEGLPTVTIESQAAGTPTIISDTITDETDMGLDMIKRLPLGDVNKWCDAILHTKKDNIPNSVIRQKAIEHKFFTTKTAAKLYTLFLEGKINSYNLGEAINV